MAQWKTISEVSGHLKVNPYTVKNAVMRAGKRGETWVKQGERSSGKKRRLVWLIDTTSQTYLKRAARWTGRRHAGTRANDGSPAAVMPEGGTSGASRRPAWSDPWHTPPSELEVTLVDRQLCVKTPTVEAYCRLPLGCAAQDYPCQIHFLRLPLRYECSGAFILREASVGMNTMTSDKTRPYLRQLDQQWWRVQVGRAALSLDTQEARDLCACLDVVARHYVTAVRAATTQLDLWDYLTARTRGRTGVQLCSVPWQTWQFLYRFADEFAADRGTTPWHCFDTHNQDLSLTIARAGGPTHARLWPQAPQCHGFEWYVPLLYEYPDLGLIDSEERAARRWEEEVGEEAIWSARYTDHWLRTVLVPHVLAYYATRSTEGGLRHRMAALLAPDAFTPERRQFSIIPAISPAELELYPPLDFLCTTRDLEPYLEEILSWLADYPVAYLPTPLLRASYAATLDCARSADPTVCAITALGRSHKADGENGRVGRARHWLSASFEEFEATLAGLVQRVYETRYEEVARAELVISTLHGLLMWGEDRCREERIEWVWQAIEPLWEQARFDRRYVLGSDVDA